MKGLIAAVILALPIAGTALLSQPASAEVIIRGPIAGRPAVVAQAPRRAEHRVLVPGHWETLNHKRHWVNAHYEYRR